MRESPRRPCGSPIRGCDRGRILRITSGAALVCASLGCANPSHSAENGTGFYLLGTKGPLAGVVPPPGVYLQNDFYVYSGSAGAQRQPSRRRQHRRRPQVKRLSRRRDRLWSTPWEIFGGNFAFSGTLPVAGAKATRTSSSVRSTGE